MKAQDMLVERINNLCKEKGLSYYTLSYRSAVPLTTLMHIIDSFNRLGLQDNRFKASTAEAYSPHFR